MALWAFRLYSPRVDTGENGLHDQRSMNALILLVVPLLERTFCNRIVLVKQIFSGLLKANGTQIRKDEIGAFRRQKRFPTSTRPSIDMDGFSYDLHGLSLTI